MTTLSVVTKKSRIIRKEPDEAKWPENQEKLYKERTPYSARTSGNSKPT
jgi:hypothetical protein